MTNIEILERLLYLQNQLDYEELEESIVQRYKREFNNLLLKAKRFVNRFEYESPDDIIELMIKKYKLPEDFHSKRCRKRISYIIPRQRTITLCHYIFKSMTLESIGSYFGNKDHATVLHSIKTVNNLCITDKKYRKEFEDMQEYFLGSVEIDYN